MDGTAPPNPSIPPVTGGAALRDDSLLRIVAQNAGIGMAVVNADRRYAYTNQTYSDILGLPAGILAGRPLADVLGDTYQSQVRPRLDRAFANERVEYELKRDIAGEPHTLLVRYEPVAPGDTDLFVVMVVADITERRRIEINASRYAAIVASSDDAIIGKDLAGVITSWNQGAEKMFGFTAEEMIGTSVLRLIPESRQHEEDQILARIRRNESVNQFETERVTRDGRVLTVSVTSSPIHDADGRIIGASKLARDISAQRRAEEERQFEQTMLMTERELTLDGILVVGDAGQTLSCNRRFGTMWGVPTDVIERRDDQELRRIVSGLVVDFDAFTAKVLELSEDRDASSYDEVELVDGRVLDRYSAPMRTTDGHYYGRVWYFRDITERKRSERALRQERDRAQRYLDAAEVMLLALDANGQITLINRKGCDLLGWTEPELLGRDWIDSCIPQRHQERRRSELASPVIDGASVMEWPVRTQQGEERMVEWRVRQLLDEEGRAAGTFSSGTDITDRRKLEEQYLQAQKMEAVGRLAGGVAHDFNNLLTVILGHCQMLIDDLDPHDPRREGLSQIAQAGESAAGLTRQLLAFSRKQIIELRVLDLNAVIRNVGSIVTRLIGEDVRTTMHLAADLAKVTADRGQVEQIIFNLAVNARDAMPNGGLLTIETANVMLDDSYARTHVDITPGPYVALSVSDTGSGMTEETRARLFEPFFTTKGPGRGTGLGLATVHGIVAQSGGSVSVYSELGHGTTFHVYFPRADSDEVAAPIASDSHDPGHGETILLVEDAEGLRELARRMLERLGYRVVVAVTPADAEGVIDGGAVVDLLLTDVVMPGRSGPDLARSLVAKRAGLKVLYMSGYTEETITHHGVLDPGIAFLHKPFTMASLAHKVRDVLDRKVPTA